MAVDSSKLLERDIGVSKGANITAPQVKMLKITNVKLKGVSASLKDNLVLTKVRNADKNKRRQEELRKKREAELENKKKKKGGGKGPKIPGMGMLDGIINGLITILWGMLVVKALDWIKNPAFKKFLSNVVAVGKWIAKAATWLLESLVSLVDWGYKLYDGGKEWIKNTFGEDAAEKFEGFMDGVKSVVQAVIFVKVIIGGAVKSIIKSVTGVLTKLGTIIKSAYNLAKNVIKTAIKAAKLILKTAGKVIRTGARLINWATQGRAGNLVNAAKAKGGQLLTGLKSRGGNLLTGLKSRGGNLLSKANPKNWTMPKVQQPGWMKKATSAISSKVSGATQWVKGIPANFAKKWSELSKRYASMVDEMGEGIMGIGKKIGAKWKDMADKMSPQKAIDKLTNRIKPVIDDILKKNPILNKLLSKLSPKNAKKSIQGLLTKAANNPALKKLIKTLKANKGASKGLGPVDKIITALMALTDYAFLGESPINAIFKGLGGLLGYGAGFAAASAVPVLGQSGIFNFAGGMAGSIAGEWLASKMTNLLANTPLADIDDPIMGDKDIEQGRPARKLVRHTASLGDHMKAPNIQAGDDATDVSQSASYEQGGEGTETIIPVNLPEVSKPSAKAESKTLNSSDSKENSGDPKLLLYAGK